jgi:CheY-like chemotaxis protein
VAGVAHELNNPLTAVMGFSELLKDAEVDINHRRQLDIIFKSAQRCQKIVQSLLSFARRQKPERKPVSVNHLIGEVLEIVSYPLRTGNITVVTRLDANLPVVLADAHQIQQVFLNILNNARQAIEMHQTEGEIRIATETGGSGIRIIISDNGPGIAEKNLRSIFDPFFTTKEVGKGTGLGLSLCYGLIKEHGGNITPLSRPGEGATFIIELPMVQGAGLTAKNAASEAGKPDPHEGDGKKILVIDDEETLLDMVRDELRRHGYGVDAAVDGETGLRLARENRYDAIFCDLKMPGMNGRQVYEHLRAVSPALCRRFIFITGDVVNEPLRQFLESEKLPCLNKPFALAELRTAIKTVVAAA